MGKIFCPDLNLTADVDDDGCGGVKMREGPVVVMVMVMMMMMLMLMLMVMMTMMLMMMMMNRRFLLIIIKAVM